MIDIHTHILPGMDDGAKDAEEAKALLALLKKQGITLVVLTPHFYPGEESLADFLDRRNTSYQGISDCGYETVLASETYLTESLFSCRSIDPLTIADTGYLLLELPFTEKWSGELFRQIQRLVLKYNVKPIISHVERYEPVKQKKEKALQELADAGCLLQFNIDSVIERKTRPRNLKLIKRGWADFFGSDCHSLTGRPPRFDEFTELIRRKLGPGILKVRDL